MTDKAERRWSTSQQARQTGDPSLEEALYQFGSDIIDEPIPERLLQALRSKRAEGRAPRVEPR